MKGEERRRMGRRGASGIKMLQLAVALLSHE